MAKKMNPEAKKRWVEALRSGRYRQLIGQLYDPDVDGGIACCAMGVLNDVSGLGDWIDDMYYVSNLKGDAFERYFSEDAWADKVFDHHEKHPELAKFIENNSGYYHNDGWEARFPEPEEIEAFSPEVRKLYEDCVMGEEEFAHLTVAKWAGLDTNDPELVVNGKAVEVHELNDGPKGGDGWLTFNQIADLIEEQL